MKKFSCLLILAATLSSTAWGACKIPDTPRKIPDGKTSSLDDMKKASAMVAEFQTRMDSYRECIKGEHDAQLKKYPKADEALLKELFDPYKKKDDAAMDEKEKIAARMNEQIAAYRAAHPKK